MRENERGREGEKLGMPHRPLRGDKLIICKVTTV